MAAAVAQHAPLPGAQLQAEQHLCLHAILG